MSALSELFPWAGHIFQSGLLMSSVCKAATWLKFWWLGYEMKLRVLIITNTMIYSMEYPCATVPDITLPRDYCLASSEHKIQIFWWGERSLIYTKQGKGSEKPKSAFINESSLLGFRAGQFLVLWDCLIHCKKKKSSLSPANRKPEHPLIPVLPNNGLSTHLSSSL